MFFGDVPKMSVFDRRSSIPFRKYVIETIANVSVLNYRCLFDKRIGSPHVNQIREGLEAKSVYR